jgi:transposase
MLMVDQYEYIRIAHRVYGKKIREIARETGHSRNTIKKGIGVGPSYCIDIFG